MGDALHLLPALSDLQAANPDAQVDWMIEDSFSEIPVLHGFVRRVIPVSTRRWRRITRSNWREFKVFWKQLRAESYDVVIDGQGLMKSSALARLAKLNRDGQRIGFSSSSIKERHAAWLYHKTIEISRRQHAIDRLRELFASAFNYQLIKSAPNYAIQLPSEIKVSTDSKTIVLLHGTTWASKHLPDELWRNLLDLVLADGYQIKVPWGNETEKKRAIWLAHNNPKVEVLAKSTLTELAHILKECAGAIAVDTGLGHMAAALGIPTVSIYGSTEAKLTGAIGEAQIHLQSQYHCSPCFLKECNKLTSDILQPPCYDSSTIKAAWHRLSQQIN